MSKRRESAGLFAETLKSGLRWVLQWEMGDQRMGSWVGLGKDNSLRVMAPEGLHGPTLCESVITSYFLIPKQKESKVFWPALDPRMLKSSPLP